MRHILFIVAWSMLLGSPAAMTAWGDDSSSDSKPVDPRVAGMVNAKDLAALTGAFSAACQQNPQTAIVYETYLRRLIDMDQVSAGQEAAASLKALDSSSGLAWAVLAYGNVSQSKMMDALANVAKAMKLAPSEPFVIRVARTVVAWYGYSCREAIPDSDAKLLAKLRGDLGMPPAVRQVIVEKVAEAKPASVTPPATTQPAAQIATSAPAETVAAQPPSDDQAIEQQPTSAPAKPAPLFSGAPDMAPFISGAANRTTGSVFNNSPNYMPDAWYQPGVWTPYYNPWTGLLYAPTAQRGGSSTPVVTPRPTRGK